MQQGESISSPLDVPADFACGNGVAVLGAFTLTENTQALVCVLWGARAAELTTAIAPGEETACVSLLPASDALPPDAQ